MKICIVGTGYVGLVTGTCLAESGHIVTCVDKDTAKITALNGGEVPIYENGLEELVKKNVVNERLFFSEDLPRAVATADAIFIAVGTPPQKDDMTPDITQVLDVAKTLTELIHKFTVVIVKSTVPVGTCDSVAKILQEKLPKDHFAVVSNPEFLREGKAIEDFMRPSRIVIGTMNGEGVDTMKQIYKPFIDQNYPMVYANWGESELIKYASNAFLAVKVGFINEIADLSEQLNLNVEDIVKGIGYDSRIGNEFLNPGPGFGGSCFPKDTKGLLSLAKGKGVRMEILENTISGNILRKKNLAKKVEDILGGELTDRVIAVLGVTFKADTDDIRHSSCYDLLIGLIEKGAKVRVYDPQYTDKKPWSFAGYECCRDAYCATESADLMVVHTEWQEFLNLDYKKIGDKMSARKIYDLRNCLDAKRLTDLGFSYYSIGRPVQKATS